MNHRMSDNVFTTASGSPNDIESYNEDFHLARVQRDFVSKKKAHISVKKGDLIAVIQKFDHGWCEVQTNNARGLIQEEYIIDIKSCEVQEIMEHQDSEKRLSTSPSPASTPGSSGESDCFSVGSPPILEEKSLFASTGSMTSGSFDISECSENAYSDGEPNLFFVESPPMLEEKFNDSATKIESSSSGSFDESDSSATDLPHRLEEKSKNFGATMIGDHHKVKEMKGFGWMDQQEKVNKKPEAPLPRPEPGIVPAKQTFLNSSLSKAHHIANQRQLAAEAILEHGRRCRKCVASNVDGSKEEVELEMRTSAEDSKRMEAKRRAVESLGDIKSNTESRRRKTEEPNKMKVKCLENERFKAKKVIAKEARHGAKEWKILAAEALLEYERRCRKLVVSNVDGSKEEVKIEMRASTEVSKRMEAKRREVESLEEIKSITESRRRKTEESNKMEVKCLENECFEAEKVIAKEPRHEAEELKSMESKRLNEKIHRDVEVTQMEGAERFEYLHIEEESRHLELEKVNKNSHCDVEATEIAESERVEIQCIAEKSKRESEKSKRIGARRVEADSLAEESNRDDEACQIAAAKHLEIQLIEGDLKQADQLEELLSDVEASPMPYTEGLEYHRIIKESERLTEKLKQIGAEDSVPDTEAPQMAEAEYLKMNRSVEESRYKKLSNIGAEGQSTVTQQRRLSLHSFQMGIAAYSYEAKDASQISMAVDDHLNILRKDDDGWWLVNIKGSEGFVPGSYIRPFPPKWPKTTSAAAQSGKLCDSCQQLNPIYAQYCSYCGNKVAN